MSGDSPQNAFWQVTWPIAGTNWTLKGHSRALERTGFLIPEIGVMLDAGVDLPSPESPGPRAILVTHCHIDHANALPMLLRHSRSDAAGAVNVFCPRDVMPRLMSYSALSWSMKVSQEHPVPPHYAEPSRELVEFIATCECGAEVSDFSGGSGRVWRPMDGGGAGVCLSVGRKAAKSGSELVVSPLHMFHHTPTVGYVVAEKRKRLPASLLVPGDDKATARNVKAARERGESVSVETDVPLLAFLCDTTTEALLDPTGLLQQCATVMVECTYLHADMDVEALRRGHTAWLGTHGLVHFVRRGPGPMPGMEWRLDVPKHISGGVDSDGEPCDSCAEPGSTSGGAAAAGSGAGSGGGVAAAAGAAVAAAAAAGAGAGVGGTVAGAGAGGGASAGGAAVGVGGDPTHASAPTVDRPRTWLLFHFSLRYKDADIVTFFTTPAECGMTLSRAPPPGSKAPPLVVLWLDSGVVQLWQH